MAKKSNADKGDRTDPRKNKSLAIRNVLQKSPTAKASEIVETVKREYGHDIGQNVVYMIKTKMNMKASRRRRKASNGSPRGANEKANMTSAAMWVDAIKLARQLLRATGNVPTAIALLKAIE